MKKKILTILGTRPELIKMFPIINKLDKKFDDLKEEVEKEETPAETDTKVTEETPIEKKPKKTSKKK